MKTEIKNMKLRVIFEIYCFDIYANEEKVLSSFKMDNRETTCSKETVLRNSTLGVMV